LIPWRRWDANSPAAFRATRLLTLVFGALQIAVAASFQNVTSVVSSVIDIAGYVTGIVLGLYFLGAFTKARERAALVALLTVVLATLPMKFFTPLAGPWYAPLCSLGLLGVGVLVEAMSKKPPNEAKA
jgi:hypothetical protein